MAPCILTKYIENSWHYAQQLHIQGIHGTMYSNSIYRDSWHYTL